MGKNLKRVAASVAFVAAYGGSAECQPNNTVEAGANTGEQTKDLTADTGRSVRLLVDGTPTDIPVSASAVVPSAGDGGKPDIAIEGGGHLPDDIATMLNGTLSTLKTEADKMFGSLTSIGFLSAAEAQELQNAAAHGDADALDAMIEKKGHEEGEGHDFNRLTLLISLISLLWFAYMIVGCLQGKPVSFVKHHIPFVAGLIAMGTQVPEHVLHGLMESLVAFLAIMGISRTARGVANHVDFSQMNEEQAKSILVVLGPLASLITTPALSTIFAPLRAHLSDRDKYVAMHAASNVDGGVGIGDFPFLYCWMKKGAIEGSLWQAGVMLPVMLFHKIVQAITFKVGPATIWKNKDLIWNILKGFKFERNRLTESHAIVAEEASLLNEFLGYVKGRIQELKGELGGEAVQAVEDLLDNAVTDRDVTKGAVEEETPGEATLSDDQKQLMRFEMLKGELEEVLSDRAFLRNHVGEAVQLLRAAMADGKLTSEELAAFHRGHHTEELIARVPGLRGWVKNLDLVADQLYSKACEKLAFSHNEVEIGRVFTAQALAIGLLVPVISTFLHEAPALIEPVASITSAVADNYAATAITWVADNTKAISFSILAGALTIYGNMANLNFLGKDANFAKSIKYAPYMLPTLIFAWMATNQDKLEALVQNPAAAGTAAGTAGVLGLAYAFREKLGSLIPGFARTKKDDSHGDE